jgi:hypothetical protein
MEHEPYLFLMLVILDPQQYISDISIYRIYLRITGIASYLKQLFLTNFHQVYQWQTNFLNWLDQTIFFCDFLSLSFLNSLQQRDEQG